MMRRPRHTSTIAAVIGFVLLWCLLAWLFAFALTPRSVQPDSHTSAGSYLIPHPLMIDPDRIIGYPVSRGHVRTAPPVPVASPPRPTKPGGVGPNPSTPPAPESGPANPAGENSGAGVLTADQLPQPWLSLARCESTLNPRAINPDGPYYGLFQFLLSTWRSVGGSGNPIDSDPAEQLLRARILQARSGWDQWPQCAAAQGLL